MSTKCSIEYVTDRFHLYYEHTDGCEHLRIDGPFEATNSGVDILLSREVIEAIVKAHAAKVFDWQHEDVPDHKEDRNGISQ